MIDGEYVIAKNKVLPAGWVGYFPESAYYGPQVKRPSLKMVTLQFGGPSGLGFYSVAQRRDAMRSLKERGTFSNGIYSWTGEDGTRHNEDAGEAVWGEVFGDVVLPRAPLRQHRLDRSVELRLDQGRVVARRLAQAARHVQRAGNQDRLDPAGSGARLSLGTEPSAEVMFLKHGAVSHDGQAHGPLTAFGSAASEPPGTLTATEDAELLYVKMPTFGSR